MVTAGEVDSFVGDSGVEHEAKKPTIVPKNRIFIKRLCKFCLGKIMTLLILEALLALLILIGIVWWTMFSGRTKGEIRIETPSDQSQNIDSNESPPKPHS
jgi:hypothetical protein